jgi:hypothetical protein
MTNDQSPIRMWTFDRSCVDEKVRPINHSQKTMITVFFGVHGILLLDILLTGAKLPTDSFCYKILVKLERVVCPNECARSATFSSLTTCPSNTEKVQEKLAEC